MYTKISNVQYSKTDNFNKNYILQITTIHK